MHVLVVTIIVPPRKFGQCLIHSRNWVKFDSFNTILVVAIKPNGFSWGLSEFLIFETNQHFDELFTVTIFSVFTQICTLLENISTFTNHNGEWPSKCSLTFSAGSFNCHIFFARRKFFLNFKSLTHLVHTFEEVGCFEMSLKISDDRSSFLVIYNFTKIKLLSLNVKFSPALSQELNIELSTMF